jgi:hypothetical protein
MVKIMIKKWLKRVTGIERLEQERAEALARVAEARAKEELAVSAEARAKMTPKERATALEEPWVGVLETHVNKENLRNGFFELDWNDQFVLQLKQEGYGFDGDKDEEIVDRWFRTLCKDVANEEGIDMTDRTGGYINVKKIAEGKSEVS